MTQTTRLPTTSIPIKDVIPYRYLFNGDPKGLITKVYNYFDKEEGYYYTRITFSNDCFIEHPQDDSIPVAEAPITPPQYPLIALLDPGRDNQEPLSLDVDSPLKVANALARAANHYEGESVLIDQAFSTPQSISSVYPRGLPGQIWRDIVDDLYEASAKIHLHHKRQQTQSPTLDTIRHRVSFTRNLLKALLKPFKPSSRKEV